MIREMMIRPIEGPWILRPVEGPWTLRLVEGPWILRSVQRPMDPTTIEGPWIIRLAGGPWLQQSVCCHDYFGLVTKNRLLWPLEKHRKRTAVTTSKQLNKRKLISLLSILPALWVPRILFLELFSSGFSFGLVLLRRLFALVANFDDQCM